MDAVRKFLSSKSKEEESDLNNSDDVRKVIEKVEVIDSVDVDAIHAQLNEIAEEKAAARRSNTAMDKKELRKTPDVQMDKPTKRFPGFEDFQSSIEKPFAITSKDIQQEANATIPTKPSTKSVKVVEADESNPYVKDNFTAFFD